MTGKRKMIFFSLLSVLAVVLRAFGLIDESGVELILSIAGGGFAVGNAGEHIGRGLSVRIPPELLEKLTEIANANAGPSSAREMVERARQRDEGGFVRTPALFVLLLGAALLCVFLSACATLSAESVRFEGREAWIDGSYRFDGHARTGSGGEWSSEGTLDVGGSGEVIVDTSRGELSLELVTAVLVEHDGEELVLWICPAVVGFFDECFETRFPAAVRAGE